MKNLNSDKASEGGKKGKSSILQELEVTEPLQPYSTAL